MKHPELLENYRYVCKDVPMDFISETSTEYLLSLRIVRIEIAPCIYENLITNLPDIEFDMDDLKELYHLRWSQENAYRDLKYPLCLKAFHSKKYTYIVQEVFARTIMHNYCSAISQHIELPDHSRKLQYQINFSEAIKICRDDLRSRTKNNAIDWEVKNKFLLTFVKVTHKQMFSNIFVALRKITAIKNCFFSNKPLQFSDKSLNIVSL